MWRCPVCDPQGNVLFSDVFGDALFYDVLSDVFSNVWSDSCCLMCGVMSCLMYGMIPVVHCAE